MNRTNKLIIAVLSIVLVLTSFLLVVAACNDKGYSVTTQYDSEQGSVTVSSPVNGKLFAEGEQVTVTVTPKADFEVDEFSVSGHSDATLDADGKYSFAISADTTVSVTFKAKAVEELGFSVVVAEYNSQQGSVTVSAPAEGNLYDEGEQVTVTVAPAQYFEVATFEVSGHSDATLDADGKYTFAISSDTTITVTFADTRVNVTVDAATGAYVTLNPQPQNDKLPRGTSVTITVYVDEGYVIDKVVIGEEVQLVDNSYTFVVTEDVTIEVTTSLTPLNQALLLLKGDVKFEGTMSASYNGEETSSTLITIYDVTRRAVWQRELSDDYAIEMIWGEMADGTLGFYMHDFTSGRLQLVQYEDYYGNTVSYEQFENVFNRLTFSDFESVEDNVWAVVDNDVAHAIALSVTGYEFDVDSVLITLTEEGVHLSITSQNMEVEDNWGDTVTLSFAFELDSTKEGAIIPAECFQDYRPNSDLVAALAEASNAISYTASYSNKDLLADSVSGYDVYVSNGRMWIDNPDDPFGYLTRPDGKIWEFFVDEDYMWLGNDPFANSILDVSSNFDLGGISPSMFEKNSDGKYVLRDRDISLYSNMGLNLAAIAAQALANGDQQYWDASEALTFAITLQDGKLYSVEYYCEYAQDGIVFRSHVDTVVFSNFNATQLPCSVYIDEDLVEGIINPEYVGRWVDEDDTFEMEITLDGARIDYDNVYEIVAIADGGYVFTTYEGDYTVVRQGDKLILTDPWGNVYQMRIKLSDWDNLLGTYSFVAYLGDRDYLIVGAEIGVDGVVVLLGDVEMTSWHCYVGYDGSLNVWTNYYDFYIWQADVEGNAIYLSFTDEDFNEVVFILYRDNVAADLSEYQGTFLAAGSLIQKVKIEGNSISVWLDGINGAMVATNIRVNTYLQYNGQPYVEMCFEVEGFVFYLQILSENKIVVYDLLEIWGEAVLVREGYVVDYSSFYGNYSAIDDANNTLRIEDGKVTVVIDGVTYVFTDVVFYDVELGLPAFKLYNDDGDLFVLQQFGYFPGYFIFNDEWFNLDVTFVKDGFVPDTSYVDGNYYGYDDDGRLYTVEIANGAVKVFIDGDEQTVTQIVYNMYDNMLDGGTFYMLSFAMNGEGYSVQPAWEMNDRIVQLYFAEANAEYALFSLYLDQEEEMDDWSEFYGVYEGDGYRMVVGSDGIAITANGSTLDVSELHFFSNYDYDAWSTYYEFRFDYNGASYVMQPADYGNCMLLVPVSSGAIYVLVSEDYELEEYYGYYAGYFESDYLEHEHFYVIDIDEDDISIYVDGELCETTVLYYGPDGGFVVEMDGKIYHIIQEYNDGWMLKLFDNDKLFVVLRDTTTPIYDWSDYYGVYEGTDEDTETTYTVEIAEGDVLIFSINGDPIYVDHAAMRWNRDWDEYVITFYAGGVRYDLIVRDNNTCYLSDATGEIDLRLDMVGGIRWRQYLGYWEGVNDLDDDGHVYALEFTEDNVIYTIDGIPQNTTFEYDDSSSTFYITVDGILYTLTYEGNRINFYYYGEEYNIDIYMYPPRDGCEWKEVLGTYVQEGLGSVTIYEDSIVISIGDVNYTVYVEDINYSYRDSGDEPYHKFFFTTGSVDYLIEVYPESGTLLIVDDDDLYEYLHKQDQPGDCEWKDFIGTWYAQDWCEYTFVITAEGIHASYDVIDYTISAASFTFVAGEGFYWIYDGVEYKLVMEDGSMYFTDVYEEGEYYAYLERVDSGEPDQPGDCEWKDFIGTWYAQDLYEYTFVITAEGIRAIYDGIDYTIYAASFNFIAGEGFYWIYDGVEYELVMEDGSMYFTDVDEEDEYYAYLERIA